MVQEEGVEENLKVKVKEEEVEVEINALNINYLIYKKKKYLLI